MIYETYTCSLASGLIEYGFLFKESDQTDDTLFDLVLGAVKPQDGLSELLDKAWESNEKHAKAIVAAGDIADFLAELAECYSASGEFNSFSAPLGTAEIREKAVELAKRLGVPFPEEEDDVGDESHHNHTNGGDLG